MKIIKDLGKLKDGRNALVIEDAFKPNYAIVGNFDGEQWSYGRYFDGDLTAFAKAIIAINCDISYERMSEIADKAIYGLIEDDEQEAFYYMEDEIEMDRNEMMFFGLEMEYCGKE